MKILLDYDRPSHGRPLRTLSQLADSQAALSTRWRFLAIYESSGRVSCLLAILLVICFSSDGTAQLGDPDGASWSVGRLWFARFLTATSLPLVSQFMDLAIWSSSGHRSVY